MTTNQENRELTTAEKETLRHYRAHQAKYKARPTVRQLAEYLGVYPNTVRHALLSLEKKGYLDGNTTGVRALRWSLNEKGRRVKL